MTRAREAIISNRQGYIDAPRRRSLISGPRPVAKLPSETFEEIVWPPHTSRRQDQFGDIFRPPKVISVTEWAGNSYLKLPFPVSSFFHTTWTLSGCSSSLPVRIESAL